MKPQSFIFLAALCILHSSPHVLSEATNTTTGPTLTTPNTSVQNRYGTEPVTSQETANTTSSVTTEIIPKRGPKSTAKWPPTKSTAKWPPTKSTAKWLPTKVSTTHITTPKVQFSSSPVFIIMVILFIILFIAFFICAYKWYSRNMEQHSFRELRRNVAHSVRTSQAAVFLERLRPSRKRNEDEQNMEEGNVEEADKTQPKQGQDDEDDSSGDYSSMDGTIMVARAREEEKEEEKEEEEEPEDGSIKSDEQEEELASEEKAEAPNADLTKL